MEVYEAIEKRYACRDFKDKQISNEDLNLLIKAANAAPVAMGDYSQIELITVQDSDILKSIDEGCAHAMPMMGDHPTYEAPTLMFICAKPNPEFIMIPYCNASCIAENIMIQASGLNLASVYIMAVPTVMQEKEDLMKLLGMDQDFMPLICVAIGYENTEQNTVKKDRLKSKII